MTLPDDSATASPRSGEAALLKRIREGDLDAFQRLVRPYETRIYRTILRMVRDRDRADDLYQEAMLGAFENLHTFRGTSAFGSWLYRVAVNRALMEMRTSWRKMVISEHDLPEFRWNGMHDKSVHDWATSAEEPAERAELRVALKSALEDLPEVDRMIVWLKDAEGESHDVIASLTGLSVSATRTRLHRARLWLRAQLAEHAGGAK